MSRFDDTSRYLIGTVFAEFGDTGTYVTRNGTTLGEFVVIVDRDIERRTVVGGGEVLPVRRNEIEIRKEDVNRPLKGDRVTVGAETWTLDGLISDDGLTTRHYANVS